MDLFHMNKLIKSKYTVNMFIGKWVSKEHSSWSSISLRYRFNTTSYRDYEPYIEAKNTFILFGVLKHL